MSYLATAMPPPRAYPRRPIARPIRIFPPPPPPQPPLRTWGVRGLRGRGFKGLSDYIDPTSGARVAGDAPTGSTAATSSTGYKQYQWATLPIGIVSGTTPTFQYPQFPDGSLIQESDNPDPSSFEAQAVYIMENGTRRWIPDGDTFSAMGLSWNDVHKIPSATLLAIPLGPSITSVESAANTSNTSTSNTSTSNTGGTSAAAISAATGVAIPTIQPTASGTISATLEPGAVYNATGGYYQNPDGTIYYPPTTASTSTSIDWSSPSTWPIWVWAGVVAAGAGVLMVFKRH